MKLVTPEEQAAHQRATITGGVKGFALGSAAALPGSYFLNKRWPYYRQLPLSLKALGVIMVVVPSFVISAEHASQRFEREQWTGIGKEELDLQQQRALERWQSMTTGEKAKDWVGRHQYSFIGGAWAASMAGAFGYIMRDPHQSFSMKIVQARMWAQGITIGVLLAAGAMTQANKVKNNDDSSIYRHVTNTDHSWRDIIEQEEKDRLAAEQRIHARPASV